MISSLSVSVYVYWISDIEPALKPMINECVLVAICQVYQWGGGKQTPQKLDLFKGGKSAMQVS